MTRWRTGRWRTDTLANSVVVGELTRWRTGRWRTLTCWRKVVGELTRWRMVVGEMVVGEVTCWGTGRWRNDMLVNWSLAS